MRKIIVFVSIVVVGLAAGGVLYAIKDRAEQKVVDGLRSNVNAQMKDPGSTQFRNEKIVNGLMCGEINSKNGYGAYAGFKRFISRSPSYAYIEGFGYVGEEIEHSRIPETHEQIIERVDIATSVLRDQNALAKAHGSGFVSMSNSETEAEMARRLFKVRWDRACS
ncbi:MAG: hypothetical protein Q7U05_03740 [Polaromonas sp.]|nr:hypothetical protein [Polaromonas sp.]